MNLRIPGPTPLPEPVRRAGSQDMINHRGPEFAELLGEVTVGLKDIFQTSNDLLIFTSSGTGGLEAAAVNLLSPGQKVLAVSIGYFGERFAAIAEAFGAAVTRLSYPQGQAADPDEIRKRLEQDSDLSVVLVTHNETSTGITNDIESIANVVKAAGRLLLVDGISSVGSIPLETDAWGCDVVVAASQKSWMSPPGVAMLSISPSAWAAHQSAKMPRFYFDFAAARKSANKGETPWTPAVGVLFGMREALRMMKEEGLEAILARHARVGDYVRARVRQMGMRLLAADERRASNAVTAFFAPDGISPKTLLRQLREEHGVVMAAGQGEFEASLLRIGHLGYVDVPDVSNALDALAQVLAAQRSGVGA